MLYEPRTYRKVMKAEDLDYFQVLEFESDLFIGVEHQAMSPKLPKIVTAELKKLRQAIVDYNHTHPDFIESLIPLEFDPHVEPIIGDMLEAGKIAGVGPMAAVAGAVSKYIGSLLEASAAEIIVENGGDLLIKTLKERRIAIRTGNPRFADLGLKIKPGAKPLGVCTSSGLMGHSLSFGKADAVTIISQNIPLADAVATALGNRIKKPEDVERGLAWARNIPEILGVLIIIEDQLGAWGEIELC
ncbi:UPF0280 family protein [Acetobacterium sp.]|uniref:UPF0280 family protein n=1 Tax=Acetobacterium sp. TaxID=1872094 RepID=UPI003593A413